MRRRRGRRDARRSRPGGGRTGGARVPRRQSDGALGQEGTRPGIRQTRVVIARRKARMPGARYGRQRMTGGTLGLIRTMFKQQGGWLMLKRNFVYGALITTSVLAFGAGLALLQNSATAQQDMVDVPMFEVDAMWPKPLPEERLLGMTIGASVDAQDNLWGVHRSSATLANNEKGAEHNPPTSAC